jgi:tRNA(fMet)-specific endonuclease VapC
MSGRFLLDTNIIIALFANEASIINNLAQADEIFIPSIALGELHYGARKSGRSQKNLERIEEFAANNTIVECDADTASQYGDVKNKLRIKGRE